MTWPIRKRPISEDDGYPRGSGGGRAGIHGAAAGALATNLLDQSTGTSESGREVADESHLNITKPGVGAYCRNRTKSGLCVVSTSVLNRWGSSSMYWCGKEHFGISVQ